jgi:hypothetical protein
MITYVLPGNVPAQRARARQNRKTFPQRGVALPSRAVCERRFDGSRNEFRANPYCHIKVITTLPAAGFDVTRVCRNLTCLFWRQNDPGIGRTASDVHRRHGAEITIWMLPQSKDSQRTTARFSKGKPYPPWAPPRRPAVQADWSKVVDHYRPQLRSMTQSLITCVVSYNFEKVQEA